MLDKAALVLHKYKVAAWLQGIERDIIAQRRVAALHWLIAENSQGHDRKVAIKKYQVEYDKLANLHRSRKKLLDEQEHTKQDCLTKQQNN